MSPENMEKITEEVKRLLKFHGAVLVGVAPIARFDPQPPYDDKAPRGHDPRSFLPTAQSVVSFAQPILDPTMDAPAALADVDMEMVPPDAKHDYLEIFYHKIAHIPQDYMLLFAAQFVGQYLMQEGYKAMIFPTEGLHPHTNGMDDRKLWEGVGMSPKWAEKYSPFKGNYGPFSHRHAATRAGLGEFGYNNLVLTKEFGPRQRFNTIITDAKLSPDPLITEPICLRDACNLCLKACIIDAIIMRDDKTSPDYRSVPKVDKDRIFIDTPVKTDVPLCRRRKDRIPNSPVRGDCVRICPVPAKRPFLPKRLEEIFKSQMGRK